MSIRRTRTTRGLSALLGVTAGWTLAAGTAGGQSPEETAITIYSTAQPGAVSPDLYRPVPGQGNYRGQGVPGYAMIRHLRRVDLVAGMNHLNFTDVAAYIDPTTVSFESLTAPESTRVVEQSFQFDLVSAQKLMERYIDQVITVDQVSGNDLRQIGGTLLSTEGGLLLAGTDGQIHAIRNYHNIHVPELPGGLITRPTLIWDLTSDRAGEHDARVTYQTSGLTWWSDYNLVFSEGDNANSGYLDLGAWVSILNRSGAGYPNARLKLIAGDVHRAKPASPMAVNQALRSAVMEEDAIGGFDEKSFFEFHLYTLGRSTTIPDNSTKQIELFPRAQQIPARKRLVYYGLQSNYGFYGNPYTDRDLGLPMNTKVDVYLEFDNEEDHGLGIPLPSGRIRVSQLDEVDNSLEFIGEDVIDHTPKDETVTIKMGSAFDVVGERRQVDFRVNFDAEWMHETIEVKLRNHKDEAVDVLIKETMFRWVNNDVIVSSHDYERQDARTVHFPVRVPAGGETVLQYQVRYTW